MLYIAFMCGSQKTDLIEERNVNLDNWYKNTDRQAEKV
jgi:hypothetical protein